MKSLHSVIFPAFAAVLFAFVPVTSQAEISSEQYFEGKPDLPLDQLVLRFWEGIIADNQDVQAAMAKAEAPATEAAGGRYSRGQAVAVRWFGTEELTPDEGLEPENYKRRETATYAVIIPLKEGFRRGYTQTSNALVMVDVSLNEEGIYVSQSVTKTIVKLVYSGFVETLPAKKAVVDEQP